MRFLLIACFLLSGCTIDHTLMTTRYHAGELGIYNQQMVYRDRSFTLPANSKILIGNLSGYYPTPMTHPVAQELEQHFLRHFVRVDLAPPDLSQKQLNRLAKKEHDFLVTIELVHKEDAVDRDLDGKERWLFNELYFDTTKVKVVIYDARSCQLLDVALIDARSGLLLPIDKNYSSLLREGIALYAASLSHRGFVGLQNPSGLAR